MRVGLGAEVEKHGRLSSGKIAAAADAMGTLCSQADAGGADSLEVFVTAPGRQAENGDELLAARELATGQSARILSSDDEARFSFAGAVATAEPTASVVAVVDSAARRRRSPSDVRRPVRPGCARSTSARSA